MAVRDLIRQAIEFYGSEAKLGRAIGCTQNAVWQAKKRGRVSAEMAVNIDRVTGGSVPKEKLRPDLFEGVA